MSKASPGPWRWGWKDDDGDEFETDSLQDALGRGLSTYFEPGHPDTDEDAANKVLIAAAPAMAQMLRSLEWAGCDCSPYGGGSDEACPICNAVKSAFMGDPRPGCGQHHPDCKLAALLKAIP